MALTEPELAALTRTVADRQTSTAAPATKTEVAAAAIVFCCDIAPAAPTEMLREASIRLCGWLLDNRPSVVSQTFKDPSGSEFTMQFSNGAATTNGYRSSGASALLSRYVRRRAGKIA